VDASFERENESSRFVNGWGFLNHVSDYCLVRKDLVAKLPLPRIQPRPSIPLLFTSQADRFLILSKCQLLKTRMEMLQSYRSAQMFPYPLFASWHSEFYFSVCTFHKA
jgi:hypothetical protein